MDRDPRQQEEKDKGVAADESDSRQEGASTAPKDEIAEAPVAEASTKGADDSAQPTENQSVEPKPSPQSDAAKVAQLRGLVASGVADAQRRFGAKRLLRGLRASGALAQRGGLKVRLRLVEGAAGVLHADAPRAPGAVVSATADGQFVERLGGFLKRCALAVDRAPGDPEVDAAHDGVTGDGELEVEPSSAGRAADGGAAARDHLH